MASIGEINFNRDLCGRIYVRYWTDSLSEIIPENEYGEGGWNSPHHYFYEIVINKTKVNLQLAFSYNKISVKTKMVCEEILSKYSFCNKRTDGNYRIPCVFEGFKVKYKMDKSEIFKKMDALFYQMKGYEKFIIYKLKNSLI